MDHAFEGIDRVSSVLVRVHYSAGERTRSCQWSLVWTIQ